MLKKSWRLFCLFGIPVHYFFALVAFPGDVENWYSLIANMFEFMSGLEPSRKVALAIGTFMWLSILPWRKWLGREPDRGPATWADLMPREDLLRSRLETLGGVANELDEINDPNYYKFIQMGVELEIHEMISQMFGRPCAKRYLDSITKAKTHAEREGYSDNIKGRLILNAAQNFIGAMIVKKIAEHVTPKDEPKTSTEDQERP